MRNLLVITAVGSDRPGIVNDLGKSVAESGCNIEDSRMTVLGGEFAVILLVSGRWNQLAKLEGNLPVVGRRLDLQLTIKRTEPAKSRGNLMPYAVEVVSLDHPGIVHQLANFFSSREINIRDMVTSSYAAAHTGTQMFSVHMTIDVPGSVHISGLREEFLEFCDQLNLDAIMEPVKG